MAAAAEEEDSELQSTIGHDVLNRTLHNSSCFEQISLRGGERGEGGALRERETVSL